MFNKVVSSSNIKLIIEEVLPVVVAGLETGKFNRLTELIKGRDGVSVRNTVAEIITTRHDLIGKHKDNVLSLLLAINPHGFSKVSQYRDYLAAKTASVTLLAGSGSRWFQSLVEVISKLIRNAEANGEAYKGSYYDDYISNLLRWVPSSKTGKKDVDDFVVPAWVTGKKQEHPLPRGLFPISNLLDKGQEEIAISAYGVDALQRLANGRYIITDGYSNEAIAEAMKDIDVNKIEFVTQDWSSKKGKPLGHGDAMRQLFEKAHPENKFKYAIVNFGGNSNSEVTALAGLMLIDILDSLGKNVFEVLPVTFKKESGYPIVFTEGKNRGHIKTTFQPKLMGVDKNDPDFIEMTKDAASNLGIRIIKLRSYNEALVPCVATLDKDTDTYNIPIANVLGGYSFVHSERGDKEEFSMDHIEILHPTELEALNVGNPDEIAEVKEYNQTDAFLLDEEKVLKRDQGVIQ